MSISKTDILTRSKKENVHFLRLQFTDIDGVIKNVEVPSSQFEKALDGQIMFDGSSIEGFTRIEESDMLLEPDLDTFRVFPWSHRPRQGGAPDLRHRRLRTGRPSRAARGPP